MRDLRRILVCRGDRIGDLMLTLPVFDALRARFPEAEITVLVRAYTADVLRGHPAVDRILLHDPEGEHAGWGGAERLAARIREGAFDAALLIYGKADLAWALWRAGVPLRVGNGYRLHGALLCNRRLWVHRSRVMIHEKDYAMRFAEALGATECAAPSRLRFDEEELAETGALLREEGLGADRPFAVVHPGNAGSARNLSAERYGLFARRMVERGLAVAFTGVEAEGETVARARAVLDGPSVDFTGRLSLRGLAMVIARARLLVVSSTGPLHLASAVGTPSVAFFSPVRSQSPTKWGPLHPDAVVLRPDRDECPRCDSDGCADPCMDGIDEARFVDALDGLLERRKP